MHRNFFFASFLLGAAVVAWAGSAFVDSNTLALTVTVVIGATYALGALELHRFRQATTSLSTALSAIPEPLVNLSDWLTPYLVGLLVMLGMLGTFLGMVVTLNGAVFALEGTTDLQAIRSAFAAPIKGLGLAFGTSVAGVAASAMLGLMSAMARRERLLAAQLLVEAVGSLQGLAASGTKHARRGPADAGDDGPHGAHERAVKRPFADQPGKLSQPCPGRLHRFGPRSRPIAA